MGGNLIQSFRARSFAFLGVALAAVPAAVLGAPAETAAAHDIVFRNGTVYDGSGRKPFTGDIAIDSDRISYVGPPRDLHARTEIDARARRLRPASSTCSRTPRFPACRWPRLSDLAQGVTLEVMGETRWAR